MALTNDDWDCVTESPRPESTDIVIGDDVLKAILSRINTVEEELKKQIDRRLRVELE